MKSLYFLYVFLVCVWSSNAYAAVPVSKTKLESVIKLHNRLSSNPKFYHEVFTVLLDSKDAKFMSQQFKNIKEIPKLDLISDTVYIKHQGKTAHLKLDMENSDRVWINGKEWNYSKQKSFSQNYNSFLSTLRSKSSSQLTVIDSAVAQGLDTESYTVTIAYSYFSSWWYSKPDTYYPSQIDNVTSEGWFSDSRYCELNKNEVQKTKQLGANRTNGNMYYQWLSQGVFPGYMKEVKYVGDNYLAQERRQNPEKFPNGIASFEDLIKRIEQAKLTASQEDDKVAEASVAWHNELIAPMIQNDIRYFAHVLGAINNKIESELSRSSEGVLEKCRGGQSMLGCMLSESRALVNVSESVQKLMVQRKCIGELIQRRQDFQKSYYQAFHCSPAYLKRNSKLQVDPIEGQVYAATIENCRQAVESQITERSLLCRDKESTRLFDSKTQDYSSLPGAVLCDSYYSPICFRQNSNISTTINCSSQRQDTSNCVCIPLIDQANRVEKTYNDNSGGRR
jgi:hypothetical protein